MILGILQARVSSTRLPGKVLKKIQNKEMFLHQVDRVKKSKLINEIVLATSTESSDDLIEEVCRREGINIFRGNLNDVLDRFYQAAIKFTPTPTHIVRFTCDCPLIDWEVIDQVINLHLNSKADYASNVRPPTFPDGLDVEVFTFDTLKKAWANANTNREREHVTPYIADAKNNFKIVNFVNNVDFSKYRVTVDNEEDFLVVEAIFEEMKKQKKLFLLDEIIDYLDRNTNISSINLQFKRNEGSKQI